MQLVVQSGAEPGRTYDLKPGKLSLGRQSINDIVVSDEQASRRHADMEVTPNGVLVSDNNSANGTFVNGTRISSPQLLKPGDTLQVGTTVLKLVDSQSGASTIPSGYEQPAPAAPMPDYGASYNPAGYGQPAAASGPYSTSTPASTPDYGAYSAPAAPAADYGAGAYGQQAAAAPDYGAYGSAAQPQYGQQASYGGYDASQQQVGGYGQQPSYGSYDASQQAGGYGQQYGQQPSYGASPAAAAPVKKGNTGLLIGIIAGVVVIAAVAVVLFLFVLPGGGGGAGDLPAPTNGTKVDVKAEELASGFGASGSNVPKDAKVGVYTSTDKPADLVSFYEKNMKDKGWEKLANSTNSSAGGVTNAVLNFKKGDQGASVLLLGPLDGPFLPAIESGIPALKGKLKAGATLVMAVQANVKDMGSSFS